MMILIYSLALTSAAFLIAAIIGYCMFDSHEDKTI